GGWGHGVLTEGPGRGHAQRRGAEEAAGARPRRSRRRARLRREGPEGGEVPMTPRERATRLLPGRRAARHTLAALLALVTAVRLAAQTPAAPVPTDAVQRELQAAQDLLARATVEFDGPQQSRSIVQLDEIVSRLEAL